MSIDSVLLFSFHFVGIKVTTAHVQIAFPFTPVLSSHSTSRLSYLLFLSLTHRTRSLSSFGVKLYFMYVYFSRMYYLVITKRYSLEKNQISAK